MGIKNYQKVLIKQNNKYYYLFNLELSISDGSLYISFPRKGVNYKYNKLDINDSGIINISNKKNQIPKTKLISYHASGLIHYKNLDTKSIYGEPIFDITKLFTFVHYSVPKISLLDEYLKEINNNDHIIETLVKADLRNNFSISIAPERSEFKTIDGFEITFKNLCNILVFINNIVITIPKNIEQHFIHLMPSEGLFNEQKYSKSDSQLFFHQKISNIQDVIIYHPNGEGIYKMFFAVPMRITPKVKIQFSNPNLTAILMDDKTRTNTTLTFKVKDNKNNFIKTPSDIINIELDAEL